MTVRESQKLALAVGVVALAGVAIAVGWAVQPWRDTKAARKGQATGRDVGHSRNASEHASASPDSPVTLEQMKQMIAALHPGMDVDELLEASETAVDVTTLPLPERRERFLTGLATHSAASWDRGWAIPTEDRLSASFSRLSEELDFELADVDCKATTCVVTLRWAPQEMGPAVYEKIIATPVALGCRLEMLPPDRTESEARAFLDCGEQRERSAGAIPMAASVRGEIPGRPAGENALHSD